MSKIAFITDIHFGCRGASTYFIERYKLFFENIFFPHLLKHNIKTVICLGDTWEDRKNLNVNALMAAREMFFDRLQEHDIKFITILGNHDVYYRNRNDVNSMNIIESAYENVYVVDEYEEFTFGDRTFGLMSWVNNENLERNLNRIKAANTHYLCSHMEINGFEMTTGVIADKGFSRDIFKGYERVLVGHFHIENMIENIHYIGNTCQTNWDDYGSRRGFYVYDDVDHSFTHVKNDYETYDVIPYTDEVHIDDFDFDVYKGKIVKVMITKLSDVDQIKYNKFLDKLLSVVFEYSIVEVVDDTNAAISNGNIKLRTTKEMINEYVNSLTIEDDVKEDVIAILYDLHNVAISMKMND